MLFSEAHTFRTNNPRKGDYSIAERLVDDPAYTNQQIATESGVSLSRVKLLRGDLRRKEKWGCYTINKET